MACAASSRALAARRAWFKPPNKSISHCNCAPKLWVCTIVPAKGCCDVGARVTLAATPTLGNMADVLAVAPNRACAMRAAALASVGLCVCASVPIQSNRAAAGRSRRATNPIVAARCRRGANWGRCWCWCWCCLHCLCLRRLRLLMRPAVPTRQVWQPMHQGLQPVAERATWRARWHLFARAVRLHTQPALLATQRTRPASVLQPKRAR